jgi:predicted small secreted protein
LKFGWFSTYPLTNPEPSKARHLKPPADLMEEIMKKLAVLLLLTLALGACNTLSGMGKDIEKAGEAIQRSAE